MWSLAISCSTRESRGIVWPAEFVISQRASQSATPVFLVVFDELPLSSLLNNELALDERRFPNIVGLARNATWYRNATTVSDHTEYALPAILTGSHPYPGRDPVWQEYPKNLFTILAPTYEIHGGETATRLCPRTICTTRNDLDLPVHRFPGLLQEFGYMYLEIVLPVSILTRAGIASRIRRGRLPPSAESRASHFRSFVAGIRRTAGGEFHFHHSLLPHAPYKYLPSGKLYALDSFSIGMLSDRDQRVDDPWPAKQGYQRHLLQLGFVDRLVGELINKLQTVDLYDRSLLVVTADHGVSFLPGEPRRTVSERNYSDILQIPLIIKFPNQREGFVDERPVKTIDILPTICDIVDTPVPDSIAGQSLLDPNYVVQPYLRVLSLRPRPTGGSLQLGVPDDSVIRASLSRKLQLFGHSGRGILRIGPYSELVGRSINSLDFQDSLPIGVMLNYPESFLDITPDNQFLPVLVNGKVLTHRRLEKPVNLAIAVNGRIEATTRTYTLPDHLNGRWEAMIDEAALLPGSNNVEVFVIDDGDGLRLRMTSVTAVAPSGTRNYVLSSARFLWGVQQKGLYSQEWWSGRLARWTDGSAEVQIPLGSQQPIPGALRLVLASTGPPEGNQLMIKVNGNALWSGDVPPGPWARTFDRLPPVADQLTLVIDSNTFSTSTDERRLGVAISKVALLDNYQRLDPLDLANRGYQYEIERITHLDSGEIVVESSAETIALQVWNTGSDTWPVFEDLGTWHGAVRLGIRWFTVKSGTDAVAEHRFDLPGAVSPGQSTLVQISHKRGRVDLVRFGLSNNRTRRTRP